MWSFWDDYISDPVKGCWWPPTKESTGHFESPGKDHVLLNFRIPSRFFLQTCPSLARCCWLPHQSPSPSENFPETSLSFSGGGGWKLGSFPKSEPVLQRENRKGIRNHLAFPNLWAKGQLQLLCQRMLRSANPGWNGWMWWRIDRWI